MKLRKQFKNRVVAVAMLAVVLFGSLLFAKPETAYANNQYYVNQVLTNAIPELMYKYNTDSIQTVGCSATMYAIYFSKTHTLQVYFLNNEKFGLKVSRISYKGETNNFSMGESECETVVNRSSGKAFYYQRLSYDNHYFDSVGRWDYAYKHNATVSLVTSEDLSYDKAIEKAVNYELSDSFFKTDKTDSDSIDKDMSKGSQDNPILDSDIGTLVLKKSKCYWVGDLSMDVSQRVQWANKTDTDFSLTNNKYAITRIEVKIGNRVTYFGDVEHHGTGKEVDNFGKVYPFKYVIATDNPHDFSFKDMLSASKTDLTKYNAAMLEHEYDLYFRVVCGTAYGTSAEWHCGNWTRYRVTDDPKQDGKNESDNGHFNDNGEWEKDKDTDVDSGGIGNVDDKDDLEDDFNHFKDSENWKDWLNKEGLDLDSAKAFIDQVADVPKMIGDLFSFFPDWVKYSFALGFSLIPVIIVIKFLRG